MDNTCHLPKKLGTHLYILSFKTLRVSKFANMHHVYLVLNLFPKKKWKKKKDASNEGDSETQNPPFLFRRILRCLVCLS